MAADLVAVEVALFEEAQDGHVQHDGPVYRIDIALYSILSRSGHVPCRIWLAIGARIPGAGG